MNKKALSSFTGHSSPPCDALSQHQKNFNPMKYYRQNMNALWPPACQFERKYGYSEYTTRILHSAYIIFCLFLKWIGESHKNNIIFVLCWLNLNDTRLCVFLQSTLSSAIYISCVPGVGNVIHSYPLIMRDHVDHLSVYVASTRL